MLKRATIVGLILLCALPLGAQEAALTTPEITASGDAYIAAITGQRINTDVIYYDPTAAAPALTTQERPQAQSDPDEGIRLTRFPDWQISALMAAIVIAIILFFARYGANIGVFLQPAANNPRAALRNPRHAPDKSGGFHPRKLAEITGIADRREALVLLAQNALHKAVAANGLLQRDSWTDRETLRRLPTTQPHLQALRALIRASERVHYGGRDVTEAEFAHHVAQITPLYRASPHA